MAKRTSHQILIAKLKAGKTNVEVLAAITRAYPHTTLGLATVNYYRNQLRRKDSNVPSDHYARYQRSR